MKLINIQKITTAITLCLVLSNILSSCKKFMDVVPDNVATINNAFTLRNEAEKFLFTCYSYVPHDGDPNSNIGMLAGNEIWLSTSKRDLSVQAWDIARGYQTSSTVICDYWGGGNGGIRLFQGISNCNIFLENIADTNKVKDLSATERARWIGEALFLKAYYNYLLLRSFGPIPINDKNLPISASPAEVKVYRQPFDSCVNYIAGLLDSAYTLLPMTILNRGTELGRVTKPIAAAIKAKLLVLAASPLFNGNPDYANVVDNRGVHLFNSQEDNNKWIRAAAACKAAVDAANTAGFHLYYYPKSSLTNLSDATITQLNIRQAICDRWNSEKIWGLSNSRVGYLQNVTMVKLASQYSNISGARGQFGATLRMAELFYTSNGVPISEDKTLDFSQINQLRTATHEERFDVSEGYTTARLNFDRENRFYADLCFDGGVWYLLSSPSGSDEDTYTLQAKLGQYGGNNEIGYENQTGYYIKKFVDYNFSYSSNGVNVREYEWPEIRVADIYLLYAEALNESQDQPTSEVYRYIDSVRNRAGLQGVATSWTNYSKSPNKYKTKNGLREIIKQERQIEMAFEGTSYWDLRRWKDAAAEFNTAVVGWTTNQSSAISYYQPRTLFQQSFVAPRDYLWPLWINELRTNNNLVQNPGWPK